MPNHVQCRLVTIPSILDSLRSPESEVDFNKVVPMPDSLGEGDDVDSAVERAAKWALRDFPQAHIITDPGAEFRAGNFGILSDNLHLALMRDPRKNPSPLTYDEKRWETFIRMLENKKTYGSYTWYDWAPWHWGTKWNAYEVDRKADNRVEFKTAWNAPFPVIAKLSADNHHELITLMYASEDYGHNFGVVEFRGGVPKELEVNTEVVVDLWGIGPEEAREYGLLPAAP